MRNACVQLRSGPDLSPSKMTPPHALLITIPAGFPSSDGPNSTYCLVSSGCTESSIRMSRGAEQHMFFYHPWVSFFPLQTAKYKLCFS